MDNDVKWIPTCDQYFQSLKKMLTEFPVLVTPDWKIMLLCRWMPRTLALITC